jgi:putative membrane protein
MSFLGLIVGIVIAAAISGFVIWIVGKLKLGLEVTGFAPAFIAAIVIAVISWVLTWLLGVLGINLGGGFCLGPIINLVVAALVLMLAGRWVKGLTVKGFGGAIVAAIAISIVALLVNWFLGLFF